MRRALRWAGWALLWAAAAAGVAISGAALFAALPVTRPLVAAAVVRWVDEAMAGSLELDGVAVLPNGGVELRGLRVFDPEGVRVLGVERARLFADLLHVASRDLGLTAELEGVEADAARRGEDGSLAIARAFAPPGATGAGQGAGEAKPSGTARAEEGRGWTVRVARLALRRGRILAEGAGPEPIEVREVTLEARGLWSPGEAWLEARLSGASASPVAAPLSLELRATRVDDHLELQRLAAGLGSDRLEAVAEGELAAHRGRVAVTRLGLSASEAGALAPAARLRGELTGALYLESDGAIATAALQVAPPVEGGPGRAEVGVAARLPPAPLAWGTFASLDRLDPSRLTLLAPAGSVTLRGRGAASGTRWADLAGRLTVRLERSRLRTGRIGPAELVAAAGGGSVDVSRLEAAAPGGSLGGRLSWREGRDVAGELSITAEDLDAFERNLAALLGRKVPDLEGSGRAAVTLSGSSRVPRLDAKVEAARLGVDGLRLAGARLRVELQGPVAVPSGRVHGALEGARVGTLELRGIELDAALGEEEGSLSFTAHAPRLGTERLRAMLRGRFAPKRSAFEVAEAVVAWPGTTFALAQPARIGLTLPSVDRLLLVAGPQRMELEDAGVARDGALRGHLRLVDVDLGRLPRGMLPPEAALSGLLTVDARAGGTRRAPRVEGTIGLVGASAWEVGGLRLMGSVAWDGGAGRVEADLGLQRARGGTIDLSLDLPVDLVRARPEEALRLEVHGRALPLDELVWLAGSYALVSGDVDVGATLTGSVGAPVLDATVAGRNGTWDDLEGLGLDVHAGASEGRLRVRASGSLAGKPAGNVDAQVALDLARLLARPEEAFAAVRRAPLDATLGVAAVSVAPLADRLELPADVAGTLDAEGRIGGSLDAPRGTLRLSLEGGAGWGARAVGARLDVALASDRSGAGLALRLGGKPAAKVDATIALPSERLREAAARASAPFRADLTLPRAELAAWGGELVPLRGTVEGHGGLQGSLGAPQGELALSVADAVVEGRPLGAIAVRGRYAARLATVEADLRPPGGGVLHADLSLHQPLGLGAAAGPILEAPVELRVRADQLDLGFLPALAPGVVRVASGAANADLAASGTLGAPTLVGKLRVAKGRLALAELGEWTDAAIEVELGGDVATLTRFDVRKGAGRLSLRGALQGLAKRGEPAQVEAKLVTEDFGVERAGMEFARFDLAAEARGEVTRRSLTLGVVVPQAEVKLPKRIPRTLQEVGTRKDITVGRPKPARVRSHAAPTPTAAGGPEASAAEPFRTVLHLVAPRRLRVRADQPRLDVELKADAIFAFAGGREEATGTIEAIRGQGEPIGGRVFVLERAKVTFTGGPIASGGVDIVARYDNPAAKVRAAVEGTLARPKLALSSDPPMDEARISMLVATGRTDVKAGAGGVNTLAAGEAGLAAAGAVVSGVFRDLLSDKLPFDSISLDANAASAGKYLTDRVYVGYVRRFDAKPERGENPDEVRVEYQLAPGWQVETRYGSGQSGEASIVWTRNY